MHLRRALCATLTAAIAASGCASATSPKSSATSAALVDIGVGVRGPEGLHATVYATGLQHASAFAFDSRGRLWVATADYTDAGNDGVFLVATRGAKPVEVIRSLHTPLGLLWYRGALYVASKGGVVGYSSLQAGRFATRRAVVTLPANAGEVNGIVLAADGRMLVGISAPCDHCAPASKLSGSIIAFRPDGRDLTIFASGIRAPVGLTYYPGTDDLFVTMNYRDDLGAQTPGDALAVVRAGSDWRNPGCYGQGGSECSGVPLATASLDPHAAVSGVAIVTGELGPAVGTAALVAEWSLGKVQRVALTRSASGSGSYTGTVSPFLTGIANPVAIAGTPTGTIAVGDWKTGTIYEIATA